MPMVGGLVVCRIKAKWFGESLSSKTESRLHAGSTPGLCLSDAEYAGLAGVELHSLGFGVGLVNPEGLCILAAGYDVGDGLAVAFHLVQLPTLACVQCVNRDFHFVSPFVVCVSLSVNILIGILAENFREKRKKTTLKFCVVSTDRIGGRENRKHSNAGYIEAAGMVGVIKRKRHTFVASILYYALEGLSLIYVYLEGL